MSTGVNRAARRSEARKAKNKKQGMVALSLMATTGLMSSYISLLKSEPSFAVADLSGCTNTQTFTLDISGTAAQDVTALSTLADALDNLNANPGTFDSTCATVTFSGSGVLNFFDGTNSASLYLYANNGDPKVFFIGNNVTFDFAGRSQTIGSPIVSTLDLEVHDITFKNSILNGALSNSQGGVIKTSDDLSIYRSVFLDNKASGDPQAGGGAIYAYSAIDLVIEGSTFTNNVAEGLYADGGAIYAQDADSVSITGSTFTNNQAGTDGDGGALAADDDVTITSSTFTGNTAGDYGGALEVYNRLVVTGSTFTGNIGYEGGAIEASDEVQITSSTFTNNSAEDDGGAIQASQSVRVSLSTFTGNTADLNGTTGNGGAIEAYSQLYVYNSTFTNNTAGNRGGAIESDSGYLDGNSVNHGLVVVESTFIGNRALDDDGGAIESGSYSSVASSTFENNFTNEDGGAIELGSESYVVNSTFVDNKAYVDGGAIQIGSNSSVIFNTFLDNISDYDNVNGSKGSDGESLEINEGYVLANIFAGSNTSFPQIVQVGVEPSLLEYNLSTSADFAVDSNNRQVTLSELSLSSTLSGANPKVLEITSATSPAVGFVPSALAISSLGPTPLDQKGRPRTGALVTAGAREFMATFIPSSAAPFRVTKVNPFSVTGGSLVTLKGTKLNLVTELFVDGIKAVITSKKGRTLVFRAPSGLTGSADIHLYGAGKSLILANSLSFGQAAVNGEAINVVSGFRPNSVRLTKAMKAEIRAFVRANSDLTTVTCKGFTSAPATAQDLRLARQRGQVACNFIKKLNPNLEVKVLKGSHTNEPGDNIRRVRLVMK